jgi:glucose 1-dehydrogenase
MTLEGKTAIVTGASLGIGRASAIELARDGADVVVNYRSHPDMAQEVVCAIESLGRRALAVPADVGNRAEVEAMVAKTIDEFGGVDILVNNAAFSIRKPLIELEVADVEKTWNASLWGVFHASQLAARRMVAQGRGGSIVVVSSVHAARPYPGCSPYNGAKAAINHMARTWAVELAPHRIRVNIVEPGWTDTPGERKYATEEELRAGGERVPVGRLARAGEIARAVRFLASEDDASYVTGSCLRVDGGFALVH